MYSFEVDNFRKLNEKFEEESRRVVHKLAEYSERFRDLWFSTSLSEDGEWVEVDYYREINNGDTIEEDSTQFPIELLWASDNEIKEWAEQSVIDIELEEAIGLMENKANEENDPYGSHFFEQVSGWLKELKELKENNN